MEWIKRYYEDKFDNLLQKEKVLVLHGSRQVGKTSLINRIIKPGENIFKGDGNDLDLQDILNSRRLSVMQNTLGGYSLVFIDEAQKVNNIGEAIKLLIDHSPDITIILTGSSSFQLSGKLGEPLTGRQNVHLLFPLSVLELVNHKGRMEVLRMIDNLLVFGSYPETLTAMNNDKRIKYLHNLRNSYLLKNILELENIRNASKLFDLLRLLAFQIGMEVSLNELSNQLGMAKQTIERYLDLLEKVFIIKKIQGFSRNLRKEITKTHRYYFWDNGVRNAIINNFNPLKMRNDAGMLWENFLFTERLKTQEYLTIHANNFFWRTYDQKEIDMVEERDGKLYGYEFKLQTKNIKAPKLWTETYSEAEFKVIDRENFLEFLLGAN
jgi:predicted AAA+ superfamily ATPase